jgi:hypothetical protein
MSRVGRLVGACLAVGAAAAVYLAIELARRPRPLQTREDAAAPQARSPETRNVERTGRADTPDAAPKAARSASLEQMSETFRNTSLLIAIRDAGFVCDEVLAAHRTGADLWTARCRDLGGYAIDASTPDEFVVRPIVSYFDGLTPAPRDRSLDRDTPLQAPPQPR